MVGVADLVEKTYFITATKQMRWIVTVQGGKVTYKSWSAKGERPTNPSRTTVSAQTFCDDVERSVACTYREGFGQP